MFTDIQKKGGKARTIVLVGEGRKKGGEVMGRLFMGGKCILTSAGKTCLPDILMSTTPNKKLPGTREKRRLL